MKFSSLRLLGREKKPMVLNSFTPPRKSRLCALSTVYPIYFNIFPTLVGEAQNILSFSQLLDYPFYDSSQFFLLINQPSVKTNWDRVMTFQEFSNYTLLSSIGCNVKFARLTSSKNNFIVSTKRDSRPSSGFIFPTVWLRNSPSDKLGCHQAYLTFPCNPVMIV